MERFTSQIIRGGYWLTPYIIEIDDEHVRFLKRTKWLVNVQKSFIPLNMISKVDIHPSILGTDITINSFGMGTIHAKNFSLEDAKKIYEILRKYKP